jgi:AraC-like DNA-binding protein/TolB-like protein
MGGTAGNKPIKATDSPLPSHVRRALAVLHDNMGERITLPELAAACAIPERTLLRQFQKFIGVAPLAYLHRVRLNCARRELTKPDNNDAISDIATRCGFNHLGRFATQYRRLFNETPSTTRRRARLTAAAAISCSGVSAAPFAIPTEKPSLAILPLHTETLQEGLEARCLTERLAATLSHMRIASVALVHLPRSQALRAPQPRNAGTQYCLLGRLTQRGERLRVIVRLVDIAADRHVWGDCFDGSVNDPLELQDRVADGVLCSVVAHLTDSEIDRANHKNPNDLTARDLAMQAQPYVLSTNAVGARRAVVILDRAVELDPSNAMATALLAYGQLSLVGYYGTESPAPTLAAAVRLAQRALLLDSNDPLVLVSRAGIAGWLKQFDAADALLTRALAIDPSSAWAWERYAYSRLSNLPIGVRNGAESAASSVNRRCRLFEGKSSPQDAVGKLSLSEAADSVIADFQRALQLRGPGISRSNCFHGIGSAHCMAGRWDEAKAWLHKAMAENPGGAWIHRSLSCLAHNTSDPCGVAQSVECMRRAYPFLTVSYHADNFPADVGWLEALANAGMPLS